MAITNGYCTLAEVKAAARITDNADDTLLENSIEGASRRIEGFTGRFFYQKSPSAVKYYPVDIYNVATTDIATTTLTVKTDDDGDGTFEDTWVLNTDYQLEPLDAVVQQRPYRRIVAIGGKTFPLITTPSIPTVEITAAWGWSYVPDDIREACVIMSLRMFSRYQSPLGVAGFSEFGAINVRAIDPDVRDLLMPYKLLGLV
jgi:hypothetical protein